MKCRDLAPPRCVLLTPTAPNLDLQQLLQNPKPSEWARYGRKPLPDLQEIPGKASPNAPAPTDRSAVHPKTRGGRQAMISRRSRRRPLRTLRLAAAACLRDAKQKEPGILAGL